MIADQSRTKKTTKVEYKESQASKGQVECRELWREILNTEKAK